MQQAANSDNQGYSHGSLVAAQHPVLPAPLMTSHILLSYPLDKRALLTFFHSSAHANALESLLHDANSNILVLFGDQDEFTTIESYTAWIAQLEKYSGDPNRLKVQRIDGGTHFWLQDKAEAMLQAVGQWLQKQPDGRRSN